MKEIIRDITGYLDFLKRAHGLDITLHEHGGHRLAHLHELLPYFIHQNAHCVYLKSNYDVWKHCIERQVKIHRKARQEAFFGVCYCGVAEFVFPLHSLERKYLGFLCVTGFRTDREDALGRIGAVAAKYGLNARQIARNYDTALSPDVPDIDFVRTLVRPILAMYALLDHRMGLLYGRAPDAPAGDGDQLWARIVSYIDFYYMKKLTLGQAAEDFHCSTSHISRLFSKHSGLGFSRYINAKRVAAAKRLLENTGLSVQEIAITIGVPDANYFCGLFKRETGCSPTAWRRRQAVANDR